MAKKTFNKETEKKAAELRRAYYKRWRASHKEQIKAYNKRYWLKKAAEGKEDICNESRNL